MQHRPSPCAAPLPWVRSKLACETGLEEGVHILRALHNDGLLVVIGQDEKALLLSRLDDPLPDLVGGHQHAMENGGAGCLSQGTLGSYADGPLGLVQIGIHTAG